MSAKRCDLVATMLSGSSVTRRPNCRALASRGSAAESAASADPWPIRRRTARSMEKSVLEW
jgi:hypothetical protein